MATAQPTHRLRNRRQAVRDLGVGDLEAAATHRSLGRLQGRVTDLSAGGLALAFAGRPDWSDQLLDGDRLAPLLVEHPHGLLYQGTAVVRWVRDLDGEIGVGVELESDAFDLGELYRLAVRSSGEERWALALMEARGLDVGSGFKAWLFDLRHYLETTRHFLDLETRALDRADLDTRNHALAELRDLVAPDVVGRLNLAGRELHALVGGLSAGEHAIHRRILRSQLLPLLLKSPFIRRAYEKPLGYAGDFELMNMLYRDHAEGEDLFSQVMNLFITQGAAATANINRLALIQEAIRGLAAGAEGRIRVASIGCGPGRELQELLEAHPELGPRLEAILIDQGEEAITYCERTLGPLAARSGARLRFVRESIRKFLGLHHPELAFGACQLIYSGGLFDYLGDRAYKVLLQVLYDALAPGGRILLGNVADHNPSRWIMEYFCDWFVIHRSPEALESLAADLVPRPASVEVISEPSGVNLFLSVVR